MTIDWIGKYNTIQYNGGLDRPFRRRGAASGTTRACTQMAGHMGGGSEQAVEIQESVRGGEGVKEGGGRRGGS
jgi:hypothetical protein